MRHQNGQVDAPDGVLVFIHFRSMAASHIDTAQSLDGDMRASRQQGK
jgi:hypothetical protein